MFAKPDAMKSTRDAAKQLDDMKPQHVIVDMREFRSSLPSLLHERGFLIDPVTLNVGDYILAPDLCVERKSIPDLIGSIESGHLYNQARKLVIGKGCPLINYTVCFDAASLCQLCFADRV